MQYPPEWTVSAPGEGAARPATDFDSGVTIAPTLGDLGVSIDVHRFGSAELGDFYRSARNLDEYMGLLVSPSSVRAVLKFSREDRIAGQRSLRYQVCPKSDEGIICSPRIYLQASDSLIEIDDFLRPDKPEIFEKILATLHFDAS